MAWSDLVERLQRAGNAAFGESVTYTPRGGSPATVSGVFEDAHEEITVADGIPVSRFAPMLSVWLGDLPDDRALQGDTVELADGRRFEVVDVRESDGIAELPLHQL